LKANNVTFY